MTKTIEQFKSDTMGGSYGNPGTGTYKGQCVSYVRLYMEEVLNIETAVWGNAVDYWSASEVLALFDKVASPLDGDIVVCGNDAGNWTGPEGHIAIWYQGKLLNQDYGGSLKVSMNPLFTQGLLGYLRKKGGTMAGEITKNDIAQLRVINSEVEGYNRTQTHRGDFDEKEAAGWVGKSWKDFVQTKWEQGAWYKELKGKWAAVYDREPAYKKQIADLEKQLAEALTGKTVQIAQPNGAEKKLQAIKDALDIK